LQDWLVKFPDAVSKRKARISMGGFDGPRPQLSADDL